MNGPASGSPTGLSAVELELLDALDALCGSPPVHATSAALLARLDDEAGIAPRHAYEVLCLAAQDHVSHLPLVDGHGNVGEHPDGPAANPRYTEVRPSPVGQLAHRHRTTGGLGLPIGLVNGNVHLGGHRPAFDPRRVLATVEHACRRPAATDSELCDLVGAPSFPSGCGVGVDLAALTAGEEVDLECTARVERAGDAHGGRFVISRWPPTSSPHRAARAIAARSADAARARPFPEIDDQMVAVRDIAVLSSRRELVVDLHDDADPERELAKLRTIHGVTTLTRTRLPAPLATLVRRHASRDRAAMLAALGELRDELDLRDRVATGER
ncbi:MAG: hypothetical protein S0880_09785 [Actinomycetota bacterium]|nr:hypothetical protein [Actinomycetota bacterium]